MTYEEMMAQLALGDENASLEAQMKAQLAQAQALRQDNRPEMRQAGRLTRAPHWLELIGGLAREGVAQSKTKQAQASQSKMISNTGAQNQAILRAIMSQQRAQPQPSVGTGLMPPQGPAEGLKIPQPNPYRLGGEM